MFSSRVKQNKKEGTDRKERSVGLVIAHIRSFLGILEIQHIRRIFHFWSSSVVSKIKSNMLYAETKWIDST